MRTLVNIRGTNGSGKSTLARRFMGEQDGITELAHFISGGKGRKVIPGRINPDNGVIVVGDYSTMAGGLDKIPSFELQFAAIESALNQPEVDVVVAEGVLASTVLGSWADHAKRLREDGYRVVWAFMETPVEECIARIKARNGGKPFKEELVHDKWNQIDRVRQKAEARPWIEVVRLPYLQEWEKIQEVLGW